MTDKSSTSTNVLDATQKLGEQGVSAVKQGQGLAWTWHVRSQARGRRCHRICPTIPLR